MLEAGSTSGLAQEVTDIKDSKSDVWLTVHRNSVWIRKTN